MKNKLLVLFTIWVVLLILTGCSPSQTILLDEEKIECYDNTLYFMQTDAGISYETLDVQSVRCSKNSDYGQWELTGNYFENNDHGKEPKPIYFHEIRGGRVASGSDTRYEICLKINNQTIISKSQSGKEMKDNGAASCYWQELSS